MLAPLPLQSDRSLPALAGAKIGIDANRPIDPLTGMLNPHLRDLHILSDTGAGWVRVNFVLGPWSDPLDETEHGGQTWQEAYGSLIHGLAALGLRIYGLAGVEAVGMDPGDRFRNAPASAAVRDEWLDRFVANFVAIARLFCHYIEAIESFNEPDDWHGQDRAWVHPAWFAVMLQQIWTAVRGRAELDVIKLVSGPLEGLDHNNNGAVAYLRETYRAGKRFFSWGKPGVPFPFDGVGYHLYVAQAYSSDAAAHQRTVRTAVTRYLNQMHEVVRAEEGQDKPLYVSEAGWRSNADMKVIQAREAFQAQALRTGLDALARDPLVEMGVWFCTQDFYTGTDPRFYGLLRMGETGPAAQKPAYAAFQAACRQPLPRTDQAATYTNQAVINAFYYAAADLGTGSGAALLRKAGLSLAALATNRSGPYRGKPIEELPNLTDAERRAILRRLVAVRSSGAGGDGDVSPLRLIDWRVPIAVAVGIIALLAFGLSVLLLARMLPWFFC